MSVGEMGKRPSQRGLSSREGALFRSLIRYQQLNQAGKGLKMAEQILKNHPDHGETLSIKGLLLRSAGKIKEGYEVAELAIKKDPHNCLCWNICGNMYEQDKNYDKAIYYHRKALTCDISSSSALKDYSSIAIFKKEYYECWSFHRKAAEEGYMKTSDATELAFSAHLAGEYNYSLSTLDNFVSYANAVDTTMRENCAPPVESFIENIQKYKVILLEECGNLERVLLEIDKALISAVDFVSFREIRARVLLKLNKNIPAEAEYWILMSHNCDNVEYLQGLMRSRNLIGPKSEYNEEGVLRLFQELRAKFPKSNVIWSLPLDFLKGGRNFEKFADEYLKMMFKRDCSSLFFLVRHLYQDKTKASILHEIVLGYNQDLETLGHFREPNSESPKYLEPPSHLLWVKNYFAQSYCHCMDIKSAIEIIDSALAHTPTCADLYITKSYIYKYSGNMLESMDSMRRARNTDMQDRYLILEHAKCALRNNNLKEAVDSALNLANHNSTPEKLYSDLNNVQFITFFYEVGLYYLRNKMYEEALAKFHGTIKQYTKYHEDTIEFYHFSSRRPFLITSCLDILRNFDKFYNDEDYVHSAMHIAHIYLLLHDGKIDTKLGKTGSGSNSKHKKQGSRADVPELQENSFKVSARQPEQNHLTYTPDLSLLSNKHPLETASSIIHNIILNNTKYTEIYETGYRLYLAKGKLLLAIRCLYKMKGDSLLISKARFYAVELALKLSSMQLNKKLDTRVYGKFIKILKSIISDCEDDDEVSEITTEYLIKENERFMKLHKSNPIHTVYGLKCFFILNDFTNFRHWVNSCNDSISLWNISHDQCVEFYQLLEELKVDKDVLKSLKNKISDIFIYSPIFQRETELPCAT